MDEDAHGGEGKEGGGVAGLCGGEERGEGTGDFPGGVDGVFFLEGLDVEVSQEWRTGDANGMSSTQMGRGSCDGTYCKTGYEDGNLFVLCRK